MLYDVENIREFNELLDLKGRVPVLLCWQRTDTKAKKVNLMVHESGGVSLQDKATVNTVEQVSELLSELEHKLEHISLNIDTQKQVE